MLPITSTPFFFLQLSSLQRCRHGCSECALPGKICCRQITGSNSKGHRCRVGTTVGCMRQESLGRYCKYAMYLFYTSWDLPGAFDEHQLPSS